MSKIKFITDSASDITKEYAEKYNIDVQGFPITVGDKSFRDGDISNEEYYDLIDASADLPVHSQLTAFEFGELFEKYADEGYEDIFYISINAHGSATYQNAPIWLISSGFVSLTPQAIRAHTAIPLSRLRKWLRRASLPMR